MPAPAEFLQGTVDLLILQTLARSPMHGYAITRLLRERSGDELVIEGAALYQALHRLSRQELVRSQWATSDTGRRVRMYELSTKGKKHLAQHADAWQRYSAAVAAVLRTV